MRSIPINSLLRVASIPVNGEVILPSMGKVSLVIDAKVQSARALGDSARVRTGQLDGEDSLFDDEDILPAGGDSVFGGK
jgi:hypothetical protein